MTYGDSPTPPLQAETSNLQEVAAQGELLDRSVFAGLNIAYHVARSRSALTDSQRRDLIRRIGRRRASTGWVR
jgi:hypothetical protein